jgi:hypothetical protein
MLCKYKQDLCVHVKNKPCVEYTVIMRLISWIHSHGREKIIVCCLVRKKMEEEDSYYTIIYYFM